MPCGLRLNGEPLATNNVSNTHVTIVPTYSISNSPGKSKSCPGTIKRKTRVTNVSEAVRDRRGQGKVEAREGPAWWDPQPAFAKIGQVPTGRRLIPSLLSSKVHINCVVC